MSDRVRLALGKERWRFVLVFIVVAVVYTLTRNPSNPYNHYVLQADAFLHGRLHLIDPPSYLELAHTDGRAYVINPPAPAFVLLPFVAAFGTNIDHVWISILVGATAAAMFWLAAGRLWGETRFRVGMVVLLAFGTNLWWAASDGGMWTFAHACAVMFTSAALYEAAGRKRPWLVGLLVGLGGHSRLTVFATAPLFIWMVLDGNIRPSRETIRRAFFFGVPWGLLFAAYLWFNYARYGSFGDGGYADEMYLGYEWFRQGVHSFAHVPRHLYAIFLDAPEYTSEFPFVKPSALGMSLIVQTPAFLYAFRARLRGHAIGALAALGLGAIPILTYWATGWSQFGYRFALDVAPALMILTASGMREQLDRYKIAVIGLCVLVNLWGALSFNRFGWIA